jgi:YihY family inner membrane protein
MPSAWALPKNLFASRESAREMLNDEAAPRTPVVSQAEYWAYLGVAAFLAILLAVPRSRLAADQNASSGLSDGLRVQKLRAAEQGRGRHADAPWQISWPGWKDILWRTYQKTGENRLFALAAGVVFYGLLALFPTLAAFVSLYGLFAKTSALSDQLALVAGVFPDDAIGIVRDQIARLMVKGDAKLSFNFIGAFAIALWSANAGTKAIIDALNVIYEEKEKRGFIRLNLVSLGFTFAMLIALTLALGGIIILPHYLDYFGFNRLPATILSAARWPVLLVALILWLAFIYRFGPPQRTAVAMDQCRQRSCVSCFAHHLDAAVVVFFAPRQL